MGAGTYFDGQVTRPRPVTFEFTAEETLQIAGDGIACAVPLAAVRVSDRLGDISRFIYLPDDAVIETSANAELDAALAQRKRGRGASLIHFLETRQAVAAFACLVLVVLIAFGVYLGPPALARAVAQRVPKEIDQRLGQASLAAISPYFGRSTLTPAERRRVTDQLRRVQPDVPAAELPRLELRSMNGGLPNAFALPGNLIVITDELVRLPARDDELAAVLAHEIAHLERRHGLQSMLRGSFALLLVTAITGDLSTLTSFAATIPFSILTRGYSRDLEREADRDALALLRSIGIDAHAFTAVLTKLDAAHAAGPRNSTYLSTHPSNTERSALFGLLSEERRAEVLAEGDAQPVPLLQPAPQYPFAMRRRNISGEVVVEFTVDMHGNVSEVRAARSSHPEFEAAALNAVRQWKFQPARRNFRPVGTQLHVPVRFDLSAPAEVRPPSPAR